LVIRCTTMASEGSYRRSLKNLARQALWNNGFRHIEEEYPVRVGKKSYRVDVVGFMHGGGKGELTKKVAFECGSTEVGKIEDLKKVFDEVRVLDIRHVFEILEKRIPEVEKRAELYRQALIQQKREYEELKRKWNRLSSLLYDSNKDRKTETLQIRCTPALLTAFKKFIIDNGFEDYEEGIIELLRMAEKEKEIIDSCEVFIKSDISVVGKEGVVSGSDYIST